MSTNFETIYQKVYNDPKQSGEEPKCLGEFEIIQAHSDTKRVGIRKENGKKYLIEEHQEDYGVYNQIILIN
jgi:hypothetical protein